MPNIRSKAKHARATERRRARNIAKKTAARSVEKSIRKLVEENKIDEAKELLPKLDSAYARAAKTNAFHRNKASRKVSRVSKLLKSAAAA